MSHHPNDILDTDRAAMLRQALPECQLQEGSPANTFTEAEKEKLQPFLTHKQQHGAAQSFARQMDILEPWSAPTKPTTTTTNDDDNPADAAAPPTTTTTKLDWHGAPRFDTSNLHVPRAFRQAVRAGQFTRPTNGKCPGFLQCNLVVLPASAAFDFLLFCQRNPQACPLIEVCEAGSPVPLGVAPQADLRTDLPK